MALATPLSLSLIIEGGEDLSPLLLQQSLDDARLYLAEYNVTDSKNARYAILQRLYAAHLLYCAGFGQRVASKSVGDVSVSFEAGSATSERVGDSHYLIQFRTLLGLPDYRVSI